MLRPHGPPKIWYHGFMPVPTVTETFQKEQLVFVDLRFEFSLYFDSPLSVFCNYCEWARACLSFIFRFFVVILGTGSQAVVVMLATSSTQVLGWKKSTLPLVLGDQLSTGIQQKEGQLIFVNRWIHNFRTVDGSTGGKAGNAKKQLY